MRTAHLADELGYRRLWFAEHHNTMRSRCQCDGTAHLHAADGDGDDQSRIRRRHAAQPCAAHGCRTVRNPREHLRRPDRSGPRAGARHRPDERRRSARSSANCSAFAQNIYDLQGLVQLKGAGPTARRSTLPSRAHKSSDLGARFHHERCFDRRTAGVAVLTGLALRSPLDRPAINVYRESFTAEAPTAQIDKPYVMAGINVMVADTDAEAERTSSRGPGRCLWTSAAAVAGSCSLRSSRRNSPPGGEQPMLHDQCSRLPVHCEEQMRCSSSAPAPTSSSPSPTRTNLSPHRTLPDARGRLVLKRFELAVSTISDPPVGHPSDCRGVPVPGDGIPPGSPVSQCRPSLF